MIRKVRGGRLADRGFALIIVLWTLVLVTALVTQLLSAGRGEAQLAVNLREAAVRQAAVDGGVYEGLFHAMDHSDRGWAANGSPHALRVGGIAMTVRIDNEAGKINPNLAPAELLNRLLRQVGADRGTAALVAAAISTWRSPTGSSTGLTAAYGAAGDAYLPPFQPFQSLDELGLVLGMTPSLLDQLKPHLSLYVDAAPDLRVADADVVAAMGGEAIAAGASDQANGNDLFVTVTAEARGASGMQARRRAVVQIAAGAPLEGNAPFRLLAWE